MLPLVVTAGGTATLVFGLADEDGDRIFNVIDDLVVISIRRKTTSRLSHEVPLHTATLDAELGVVTLDLTEAETMLLAPPITLAPQSDGSDLRRRSACRGRGLLRSVLVHGPLAGDVHVIWRSIRAALLLLTIH